MGLREINAFRDEHPAEDTPLVRFSGDVSAVTEDPVVTIKEEQETSRVDGDRPEAGDISWVDFGVCTYEPLFRIMQKRPSNHTVIL